MGVVVILSLAAAVTAGALWVNAHKTGESAAPIPAVTSSPDTLAVSVERDTGTVLVGVDSAPVTVELYGDLLCPACRQFERTYADQIHEELVAGAVRVRFHLLNLLDDRSDSPGHSLLAANAAEGARGYDAGQLTALGRRLGVTDERFADEVISGTFEPAIRQSLSGSTSATPTGYPS